MNFKQLADRYSTPLYVYDFDYMKQEYQKLKEAFSGRKSIIAYAVKSNSNLSVIKHLGDQGAGADCVSIGEVRRALLAGIPPYKIIFSGVGKTDDEIKNAVKELLDEIVIVDSCSIDNTVEICKKYTDKVFVTDWPGFGPQKNRALAHATCDWVLSIDADECVTPELKEEIQRVVSDNNFEI